jgi:hypothetical protein
MATTLPQEVSPTGVLRGRRTWLWGRPRGGFGVPAGLALLIGSGSLCAFAQEAPFANQPLAIDGSRALVPSPCKLVVPESEAVLQPMKIRPEQVPLKNRLGCLSPADAIYGADGCPVSLCGKGQGAFQLPPP